MVDFFSGDGGAVMTPALQTAYQRDPRVLMASLLSQQGQQQLQTPTPNGLAALAKALTIGLGGATQAMIGQEYADRDKAAQGTLANATQAFMGGQKEFKNPDDPSQTLIPGSKPGDYSALVSALAKNPDTAPMGLNAAMSMAQMQAKSRLEQDNELAKNGLMRDPQNPGQIIRIQGFGTAKGGNAADEIRAQTPAKVDEANALNGPKLNYEQNLTPIMVQRAGGEADARNSSEARFAAPIAANRAAGAFYGAPQKSEPGSTFVQMSPGAPGAAPSGTTVYANPNPAPGTQQGKKEAGVGEQQAKAIEAWHNDALSAAAQNQTLGMMRDNLSGAGVGSGFDARKAVADTLASFGVDPSKIAGLMDPAKAGNFSKGTKELLIDRAKAFGANPSNAEDRRIEQALVNASDPIQATTAFMDWLQSRNNQKIAKFEQGYSDYQKGGDPLKFDIEWSKKFGGSAAAPPAAGGAAASGGAGGSPLTATGPNGAKLQWNGSAWVPVR